MDSAKKEKSVQRFFHVVIVLSIYQTKIDWLFDMTVNLTIKQGQKLYKWEPGFTLKQRHFTKQGIYINTRLRHLSTNG